MYFVFLFFGELFALFLLSRSLTRHISYLLHRVTHNKTATIYSLAFLFLPGTAIHEVAHYLMAHLVFVPAGKLELMPKLDEHGVKLGSVAIARTDPVRRALIGVAPFLFGTAIILITLFYAVTDNTKSNPWLLLLAGYIVFEIGNTMFSSRKDMEGTLELLIALLVIGVLLYFVGFRLPAYDYNTSFSESVINLFQTGSIFLTIPLFIDVVVIIVLKLIISLSNRNNHRAF